MPFASCLNINVWLSFDLGRCVGAKGPGIVLLIPVIDRAVKVDLREQVREVPHPDFDHQG